MKTNIKSRKSVLMTWWTWNEFCDDCGEQTRYVDRRETNISPKIDSYDRCSTCLSKEIDKRIEYGNIKGDIISIDQNNNTVILTLA